MYDEATAKKILGDLQAIKAELQKGFDDRHAHDYDAFMDDLRDMHPHINMKEDPRTEELYRMIARLFNNSVAVKKSVDKIIDDLEKMVK